MLFNSYTFIFLFLPAVFGAYWVARRVSRDAGFLVLVLGSLFFYGYWDIRFLPLLLLSIAVNFGFGEALHRLTTQRLRWWVVAIGVVFNLGLLGWFKYANFLDDIFADVTGQNLILVKIILPIGISFFTFQQITYLIDIYRSEVKRYPVLHYALFVSFFPQLIAGPIVHHSQMLPQFARAANPSWTLVARGMTAFIAGLFKKLVLADNIAPYNSAVFRAADAGEVVSFVECWGALVGFSFQMYFDFSGYSDMALGLALMFGIRLPVNFNSPYKSRTIIEHWRRWNMTLGSFLRSYVFLPLGGSKRGDIITMRNMMIVMFVSGVWHGAGWGFVLWGILNGIWLWLNYLSRLFHNAIGMHGKSLIPVPIAVAMMFLAVSFGWCFFRPETVSGMRAMTQTALGMNGLTLPAAFAIELGSGAVAIFETVGFRFEGAAHVAIGEWATRVVPLMLLSGGLIWLCPNVTETILAGAGGYEIEPTPRVQWRPNPVWFAATATGFVAALIFASSISEFLYFQF